MKSVRSALAVLSVLALPALGLSPRLAADEVDAVALYKKVVKSCVFIVTPVKNGYAMGSGSLIDVDQKLVVTNYHVVEEEKTVFVQFPTYLKDGSIMNNKDKYIDNIPAGLAIKGTVLYRDKSRDLALVKLSRIPRGTPAIVLAKGSPQSAETTWNIGSPGAVKQVFGVTKGEVRTVGIEKMLVGDKSGELVFEVNARMVCATNPTNPGDSGGPLFNSKGEQVAVTESGDSGASLVNHFVDVTEIWALLKEKKIQIKGGAAPVDVPTKGQTKVVTPMTPGVAGKVDAPPAAGPSDADEAAAKLMLKRASIFASGDENRPDYIRKLKEIVKKYPDTAAGRDAKKMLDGLK